MYRQLLKKYVDNLKKEDVIKYIENNNYRVNNKEIDVIYFYIKNYWKEFLNNDEKIWKMLKNDVSSYTYNELVNLYNKYKKYI